MDKLLKNSGGDNADAASGDSVFVLYSSSQVSTTSLVDLISGRDSDVDPEMESLDKLALLNLEDSSS